MDLLFKYEQEKVDRTKKKPISKLFLSVSKELNSLFFNSYYDFDYTKENSVKKIKFEHELSVDLISGEIMVKYNIINDGLTHEKMFKSIISEKKYDFRKLFNLVENGFARGEKRNNYWGVKFTRAKEAIEDIFIREIQSHFNNEFYKIKNYKLKTTLYPIFDLVVDFYLDKKGIKAHDNIYFDIQYEFPKKKWLEKNENKFLPAVLDSYGIKSKFLIKELNKISVKPVYISSLNYLCKLFGKNHIDYLKRFVWENHCYEMPPNKKIHELKNESEKNFLVQTITNWEKELMKTDSFIYSINKLLSTRELLEERGLELKYKAKNDSEFDNLMELWNGHKLHFSRGYKVKYLLPKEVIDDIEQDIVIGDETFKPKLLLTEEDYRIEGYTMKNCMSKQFMHGSLYLFISLKHKRKKINLQYRKGNLVQSYGKANTAVPSIFTQSIDILSDKLKKYQSLEWTKEKYDFITNSL